jgi:hypothetical protein
LEETIRGLKPSLCLDWQRGEVLEQQLSKVNLTVRDGFISGARVNKLSLCCAVSSCTNARAHGIFRQAQPAQKSAIPLSHLRSTISTMIYIHQCTFVPPMHRIMNISQVNACCNIIIAEFGTGLTGLSEDSG